MRCIDLFAGAGGFSQGARQAGLQVAWAANHWPAAVLWHSANHPGTSHACQDLQQADFREAPPHDVLLASPACQGHSKARGTDRPHHDAQRATAWAVVTCAEVHRPAAVVVENVPEFQTRWALWPAWCAALQALGYTVAPHVLDAADFGVPQHRLRLFVVATRSTAPLQLRLRPRPHVPASAVLNFEAGHWSPVHRPGRAAATLARVQAGQATFGRRFVMPYYGSGSGTTGRSIHRPIGTITTRARWAVVDGDRMRMVSIAEVSAFMGFPPSYRLPAQVHTANMLLGNAVPPPVASTVLRKLRQAL